MDYLSPQTRQTRYRKKDGGYYPVIEDSDEDTKEQQSQNNNASPLKDILLCRPRYATHLRTNRGKESKALFLGLRVSLLWLILRRGCLCSSLGRGRILAEAETLLRLLFYYRGDLSLLCTLFFCGTISRCFGPLCFRLLCHTTSCSGNYYSLYAKQAASWSCSLTSWQARRDSNPQHAVLETAALPIGATGLCLFLP